MATGFTSNPYNQQSMQPLQTQYDDSQYQKNYQNFGARDSATQGALTRAGQSFWGNATQEGLNNLNTNTQTGLNQLNTNTQAGLGTLNENTQAGFTGVNDALTSGFGGIANNQNTINDNITTVNDAVTAGNTTMQTGFAGMGSRFDAQDTNLNKLLSNQDTYFGALSDSQNAAKAQVSGLADNFNAFNTQYGKDVTRADNARNDLQTSFDGNFNNLSTDIGNRDSMATMQRNNIMKAVSGTAPQPTQPQGFVSAPQQAAPQQQNPLVTAVNSVRNTLSAVGNRVNPDMTQQMMLVSTAFDQGGNFQPTSQGTDGSIYKRAIDQQGNLQTSRFDQLGNPIGNSVVNLNQVFSMVNNIQGNMPYGLSG